MSRRQNSSCDQCRKGKRACDAVWLRDRQLQRHLDVAARNPQQQLHQQQQQQQHHPQQQPQPQQRSSAAASSVPASAGANSTNGGPDDDGFDMLGPCTNCARTNKQCTFEWVQSQQQSKKRERQNHAQSQSLASSHAMSAPSARQPAAAAALASGSIGSQSPAPSTIPLRSLRPSMAPPPATASLDSQQSYAFAAPDQPILLDRYQPPTPDHFDVPNPGNRVAFVDGSLTTTGPSIGMSDVPTLGLDPTNGLSSSNPPYMDVSGVLTNYSLDPFSTGPPTHHHNGSFNDALTLDTHTAVSNNAWSSPISSGAASPSLDTFNGSRKRRRTQSPARNFHAPPVPVPPWALYSADRLARSTNGNMIGETMMKIYHDVMEGALSCWLTEQTCPYNSLPATPSSTSTNNSINQNGQSLFWTTFEDMQREWGPNWSNRVYRRVVKLDKMSYLLGLKKLSLANDKKVSNALNSAVMAFTAQWAQASQRGSARWPPGSEFNNQATDLDLSEDFDRTLQKSFWNQARRALDECSEIDSFRLVFAEIIFGLTQKYAEEAPDPVEDPMHMYPDHGGMTEALEEILRADTQQIWLERATRRLHVLRRRVELYDRQRRKSDDGRVPAFDMECRKTIDLLFWLAVMFDTISAAMTERPLTVSDEDSSNLSLINQHPSQNTLSTPASASGDLSRRWNVILTKDQQTKMTPARWPCSDEVIASELTDAAPVKVLLYRKVTRFQTLVARDVDAITLEETIKDSMLVYHHWTTYYSALFRDCIDHHLYLSSRIQSWYVCLFGHWLLATLLFADLMEVVAKRGDGFPGRDGQARAIRKSSVQLISDLAQASTPRHDDGLGELDNFHHAVNEGALLTEPWTMILIRTFSRAAVILLEGHYGYREDNTQDDAAVTGLCSESEEEEEEEEEAKDDRGDFQRCADCVKALWYLGRKSDMARQVANVLGMALQRARVQAGVHG